MAQEYEIIEESFNSSVREYCFTINNYTPEVYDAFMAQKSIYKVCGKEIGESGTPHMQCYIYYQDGKTFSALKKKFPTAHIGVRYKFSSAERASKYCKKDGDYEEEGKLPKQGKRTDIDEVRDMVVQGRTMRDIVLQAKSYQSVKMAEVVLKYHEKKRSWRPDIYWFWGPTSCGKTHYAVNNFPDVHMSMTGTKWWEGYDGHKTVVIDDFREGDYSYHYLLRLFDKYELRVENKGGSRQMLAKNIVITSPYPPDQTFLHLGPKEMLDQLVSRIKEIKHFDVYHARFEEEVEEEMIPESDYEYICTFKLDENEK